MEFPRRFGKYELLERIAIGGMAEVFRARQLGSLGFERIIAVKRILANVAADETFIRMFIDEAKIAGRLTHTGIVQIYDLGQTDEGYFIAMEYVHGKDLRAVWDRQHAIGVPLDLGLTCRIFLSIAEALHYAHSATGPRGASLNIVHRDVSPQNILISYDGAVKVADFGLAKASGRSVDTQAGIVKGKLAYMSPEQARGMPLDGRSDVYALGVVLFEMLTNTRLFYGETDLDTIERLRRAYVPPVRSLNPRVPVELEELVFRALERDVAARCLSAMDFHDELQALMYALGLTPARDALSLYMHNTFPYMTDNSFAEAGDDVTTAPEVRAAQAVTILDEAEEVTDHGLELPGGAWDDETDMSDPD